MADHKTDPVFPEPRQFPTKKLFRTAMTVRIVLYFFCISNFLFLTIQWATAPPRREIVYERRDEVQFPSVRICPMVPEGNISRPHKAFISRKPGEDYNVPAADIQEIQYTDPRGVLKCHTLDLSQFKVQTNLPGFRAHIHFYATFSEGAPIVGLSFGFYDSKFGPDYANITYGLVNHVAYGSTMMTEGPDYTLYTWNGASMPIANDKKGELTILNFDISNEVAVAKPVYDWGFWTWVPLLFASFQYRVLYDFIFPEVDPPKRKLNNWLAPSKRLRRWLYEHAYIEIGEDLSVKDRTPENGSGVFKIEQESQQVMDSSNADNNIDKLSLTSINHGLSNNNNNHSSSSYNSNNGTPLIGSRRSSQSHFGDIQLGTETKPLLNQNK